MRIVLEESGLGSDRYARLASDVPGKTGEGNGIDTRGVPRIYLKFTYTNTTSQRVDFEIERYGVQIVDDNGMIWLREYDDADSIVLQRILLEPGDSITLYDTYYGIYEYRTPSGEQYVANVTIKLVGLPGIPEAHWGFTWDRGDVKEFVSLAPPATSAGSADVDQGGSNDASVAANPPTNTDIFSLLPTSAEVPSHVVFALDQDRDLATMTSYYDDPAATLQLYQGWGWQGNVTRSYNMGSTGMPPAGEIEGIYTSIHLFSDPGSANAAAEFIFTDMIGDYITVEEITLDPIGDWSRALYGTVSYGNQTTIVVQRGPIVFLIYASSRDGNPTIDTWNIAEAIVRRAG